MKYTLYEYEEYLRGAGRSEGTIDKYLRDVDALLSWLDGEEITQEAGIRWREHLLQNPAFLPILPYYTQNTRIKHEIFTNICCVFCVIVVC